MGGLACGEEDEHLLSGLLESFTEALDRGRQESGGALRAEGETDVGGGEHFLRQLAEGLAELGAESNPTHL